MSIAFPSTVSRVRRSSPASANRSIDQRLRNAIEHYRRRPEEIEHRLTELDREWDMERLLEANAASLALGGTVLGTFVHRGFLALPIVVGTFLLQHALQGWCPPVPVFRSMGVRTAREIETERHALKLIRGDYGGSWDQRPVEEILGAVR